jgi:hypothetical protein
LSLVPLLATLRQESDGRYACLLDRAQGVIAEDPAADEDVMVGPLRAFLERQRDAVFALGDGMAAGGPAEDAFAGWDDDDFFVCVVNGRVAAVVACTEPEALHDPSLPILRALVDAVMRTDAAYRLDQTGRGLFLGRPRLDMVVARRHEE